MSTSQSIILSTWFCSAVLDERHWFFLSLPSQRVKSSRHVRSADQCSWCAWVRFSWARPSALLVVVFLLLLLLRVWEERHWLNNFELLTTDNDYPFFLFFVSDDKAIMIELYFLLLSLPPLRSLFLSVLFPMWYSFVDLLLPLLWMMMIKLTFEKISPDSTERGKFLSSNLVHAKNNGAGLNC